MPDLVQKKIKQKYTSGIPGKVEDATYCYYDTAPKKHKELAIVCVGYEKCAPDFEINRSNYPYFFVKYTISGEGVLYVKSKTLPLRAGTLTGFEPGTPHHYKADPHNPMEHIFITFLGNDSLDLMQKSKLYKKHIIYVENQKETLSFFTNILQLGIEKPEFSQEICCACLRNLLLNQASYLSRKVANFPISKGTYQECKNYIDANFSSIKSPSDVAEKCSIDVRYMSSLFKRYCHVSPSSYIKQLKLNKAVYLLLTTNLTIKEIAFQIGFKDPYHFSKDFKKAYDASPNNYRKEHS